MKKTKRQPTRWEKIFANEAIDKGLVSKKYTNISHRFIGKNQMTQSKNG